MSGTWLTSLLAITVVVVAMLILLVAAILLPRTAHAVRHRFYCPWRSRNVMVRFLTGKRNERLDVLSCTAFADPLIVTCERRCLHGVEPPGPAKRSEVAVT